MLRTEVTPDDLMTAAWLCQETLRPAVDEDWGAKAGDLNWDCRRTLDHIVDTLFLYSAYLASRATERISPPRNGDATASPAQLVATLGAAAAVLSEVARAAPPGTIAFHPAGMADISGWLGMACVEILIHSDDIASGLELDFRPPEELARRVVTRLFPWAPGEIDSWDSLRWSAGRAALPDCERLGTDWHWHCAPLADWDGTIKKRTAPPAWI